MASISIDRKKAYNGSGSWAGLSGSDTLGTNLNRYVVYRAPVNYSNASAMTSCSFSVSLSCANMSTGEASSHSSVVSAFLYTFDPTTGSSISGNYTKSASTSVTLQSSWATRASFSFTGLNITSGYVYIAIITSNSSGTIVDAAWHVSTGGYGIQAPAISANFAALTFSLSVSSNSVATGGNQTVTIGNGYGRNVTVTIKYGGTQLYSGTTNTGSLTVAVQKSWFTTAGITTLQQFNVTVTCSIDSSLSAYFTVTAGDDMKPTVSIPSLGGLQVVNEGKAATYFPDTAIAGYSKCKVTASVASGSNASISSVVASWGSNSMTLTLDSVTGYYSGTTRTVIAGANTVMTVTVTDSRGLTASVSKTLAAYAYSPPAVTIVSADTYRCDDQGAELAGGAYWKARAKAVYYTDLPDNGLLQFTVTIAGGTAVNLESDVQTALQGGSLAPNSRYQLTFTIEDKVAGAVTRTFMLDSATRNVVIMRNSTGTNLGVGTTPEGLNSLQLTGSTIELPASGSFRLGGMEAQAFIKPYNGTTAGASFGKDFLYLDLSNKIAAANAISLFNKGIQATGWANYPSTLENWSFRGFRIPMIFSTDYAAVILIELTPTPGRIWINVYNGGLTTTDKWSGWKYIAPTAS